MKLVLKILGVVVALFVGVMILQMVASESGEVVVLTTTDADGNPQETRLWIVEYEDASWLRSGSPAAGWYQRLVANDAVTLERDEQSYAMRAVPVIENRQPINDLMNAKYGWADDYIGVVFGRDDAIAIRLDKI